MNEQSILGVLGYLPDRIQKMLAVLISKERPDIEGKDQIYIETKIGSILKRLPEIDEQIHSICEGWRLERLGKPELAILRLAVYEITNDANIPTGVAINEAVELAKKYGEDKSKNFVNGILASIVKEM